MGLADVIEESEEPHAAEYSEEEVKTIRETKFQKLQSVNYELLKDLGFEDDKIYHGKSSLDEFIFNDYH